MKRLVFAFACACFACGPGSSGDDGGTDATTDATQGTDAAVDAPSDVTSNGDGGACQAQVQAVIDSGCVRCWPAGRGMCTQGNAAAVEGMLACLTGCCMCWDELDPNTAGPCMQNVITSYGDSNTTAVQNKLQAVSCLSYQVIGFTAIATEMSNADRATFATCVGALTTCDANALQTCLNQTQYNASLCQN